MIIKFMIRKNLSWKKFSLVHGPVYDFSGNWTKYWISANTGSCGHGYRLCALCSVRLPVPKYMLSSIAPVLCLTLRTSLRWVCLQMQSREPDGRRWGSVFTSLSCNFAWYTRGWWAAVLSQVPGGLPVALGGIITVPWLMCQKRVCGHTHLPIRSHQ